MFKMRTTKNISEIKFKISRNYFNNFILQIIESNLILKKNFTISFALF